MATLTIEELKRELAGYIGTTQYFRHFTGGRFTEGVKALADKAGAYWLIDAIFSWQVYPRIRAIPFQVWTLKVRSKEPMARLEMREDIDQPTKVVQVIPYTDFPEGEIELWMEHGVLILPSEH